MPADFLVRASGVRSFQARIWARHQGGQGGEFDLQHNLAGSDTRGDSGGRPLVRR